MTPKNQEEYMTQLRRFNMGLPGEADCPVFDGCYEYCKLYSGGSVDGAALLARGEAQIALNWAGGMHHDKKAEVIVFGCFSVSFGLCGGAGGMRRRFEANTKAHHKIQQTPKNKQPRRRASATSTTSCWASSSS